jgi:hypothetical protein
MPHGPRTLYKYRAIDPAGHTERIFAASEAYFAGPFSFNDPFESRFTLSMAATAKERVAKFMRILPVQEPMLAASAREQRARALARIVLPDPQASATGLSQVLAAKTGLFSLSAKRDDILMWSHYADNHRGICLEFAVRHTDPFLGQRVLPVSYSRALPVVRWFQDDDWGMVKKVVLTKAIHWKYEAEWRIVDPFNGAGVQVFPADILTGVILGARIASDTRDIVIDWAKRHSAPMNIFQAVLNERAYQLTISPVGAA